MKDIYKSKKQLIQELEEARRLLSQKAIGGAGADIAGQKATSATLLLMQKAIYSATDAIEVSDPEGHHIYQNRAYTDLFEYTDEELDEVGGGIAVFEVNSIGQQVFDCIKGGESWKGEVEVRSKSGRVFGVFLRADAIRDDEEKIVGLMAVYTDISERKQLEYQLRRKHDELQLILDSIPAYVFYKDREGKLLNINKAAMSLAYAPKEKLLQKTVYDLTPQAADRYNRDDMEVIKSGLPKVNIEEPLDLPSGKRWLKTDKLPIKDDEGNTLGLVGFSVDITDRKKAEEELLQSEAKYRFITEKMNDIVWILDMNLNTTYVSPSIMGMLGYTPEERYCQIAKDQMTPGSFERASLLMAAELKRDGQDGVDPNRKMEIEIEFYHKNGSTVWTDNVVSAIRDANGKPIGLHGVSRDITERRKAEETQRTSEEKLRIMFESMTDSVILTDLNGTVLDANASALKTFGYEKSELLGRNGLDIVAFEDRNRALKNLATSMYGEEIKGIQEYRIMDRNGNMLETEITVNRLSDGSGKPYGFIVVIRDVTSKKVAEEQLKVSESRMRSLFQVSPDVIMNIDRQGKILFINRATTRSVEETIGTMVFDYIPPEYHAVYAETIERVYSTGKPGSIEIRGLGPGKRVSWYEARFVTVESGGDQRTLMVAATDITERRQAEEALKESESKYRFLTESMNDIVWTVDMNFRSTYVSPSHTRILGYTPEERIGQLGQKFVTEESFKRCIDALAYEMERDGREGVDPNRSINIEIEYYHKNGSTVWMEDVVTAIRDNEGKPIGLHGVSRDITERKKAENALRESEQKLRWMFSSMADGVVVTDLEGRITDLNESQLRMFGFRDKGELIGKGGLDFLAERERGKALAEMFQVYEKGVNTGSIYTVVDRDGREFECELSTAMLHDAAGKPSGTVTVMRDVTERTRMEQQLRESEERYRLLAENVSDVIWTMDLNLRFTYISPSVQNIRGYTAAEALEMPLEETVTPGSMKTILQVVKEEFEIDHTEQYVSRTIEVELKCKDGSTVWTEMKLSWLHDTAGNRIGIMGVTRDIGERRKAERAVRESEERYRLIADNVSDVIWTMDLNARYTYISPSVERIWGYTADEMMAMSAIDLVTSESASQILAVLGEELTLNKSVEATSHRVRTLEMETKNKDSSKTWLEVKITLMRDPEGRPTGVLGVSRDVTERRKVQEALRETSEKLRVVFDSIGEAVTVVDLNGNIVDANKEALRLHGFVAKDAIVGKRSSDLVAPVDRERTVKNAIDALKGASLSGRTECKLIDMGGREFDGEFNVAVIRDSKGNPSGFIGVTRNITERKQMQDELQRSEEFFKEITENSSDIIIITDKEGSVKYCSRSAERFTGYRPEDIVGSSAFKFIHADDVQRAVSDYNKAIQTKDTAIPNSFRIVHKNGSERFFEGVGKNLLDNPSIAGFIMNVRDVTERKSMEEALRRSEETLRVTFDSMMDGIVVSDQNINIIDVNKAVLKILGVETKEKLIGRNPMEVIKIKDQAAVLANLEKMFSERRSQEKVEYGVVLPSGKELEIEVSTAIMHDSAGKVIGFVNAIRDITERKRADEALKESEEKYRSLVEREKDVIVSVDALGFVKSVNSAVRDWGYTTEEVLKMNFLELIAPEWREVTARDMQQRLLETGEHVGETMVVRKDGEEKPIEYSAVVVQEEGKYAGAQAIVRDISERKKAEEALQARERYFRAISDQSSGAALVVNQEGNIMDVTGGLERISGHTRESTIGRSAIEFIHPDDMEKAGRAFDESVRNPGKTVAFEARLKNARGEWQWTESMITNLLDNPDVHGIVNHLVDITERKKIEEEIKNHAKRIEALYSVAQVISQSVTLDAMLNDSLDRVCSAMGTESGLIFMLELDENALKLKAYKGVEENIKEQFSTIALTEQGIENIMKVQGPVTEVDEAHTVADIEGTKKATEEIGRKSLAATPLFRGNELQGFLVVFSSKERKFNSEDLDLFKATANEISIGINNLMLLEKTREMSVTDELTGLYNRRYFFDMLDVEINRSGRTGHPFSVIMLDLDGFKEYNDKYGHSNGDAVLETFSRTLKDAVRKSDLVFRYGGDEFALILPSADAERARKIIQRSRAKWEKVMLKQAGIFGGQVGFSSGIAEYPKNAESSDGLVFLADAALYQAKKKGYEDKLVSELRTLSTDIIDIATQDQVYALAATVDARDPYTYGHSQRVADIAMRIGEQIGMTTEDLAKLHAAALLHDIGKVGVPDSILTKPGKPTPEEWDIIKKHCAEGARILGYVKELTTLVPIVLHHHEWYDGSGYPSGLRGLDIPSGARITSVADAYDTMVTKRPYRNEMSRQEACEELKRSAGTQFDPAIVDVWVKLVEQGEK